ncbi:MAG: polysaccharide pyruvyl transferase family protein [Erythrobacter sp.]
MTENLINDSGALAYVIEMQELLARSIPLPRSEENYALLDFPNIRNVGDSAIWLGELAFFRKHVGRPPSYICSMADFDAYALESAAPDGPIYLHGGGNFGDIWIGHQEFREMILTRFPSRKIIQLPQSLHFKADKAIERCKRVIDRHADFTLLVRDQRSLDLSSDCFDCAAYLAPDMAFSIGSIKKLQNPLFPILAMLRQDKEKADQAHSNLDTYDGIPIDDWITEPVFSIRAAKLRGLLEGATKLSLNAVRLAKFSAAAEHRFNRGVRQLSKAEIVITDRLHVHIISLLLGRVHGVLDNSYGKIANFRAAFPEPDGLTFSFEALGDAVKWAKGQAAEYDTAGT